MTHIWLYNPATDAYWNAPVGLVEHLTAGGWEDRGEPVLANPVTDEHAAWREARAAEAAAKDLPEAAFGADKPAKPKTTTTKSAASGDQEG
jgi:hypothetical protein